MSRSKVSRFWLVSALALVLLAFSLFTAFGERGLLQLWRLSEEKKRLSEKSFRLHQENEVLRSTINSLLHNDRYLEKKAREDLRFVGPGEIVYQFASEDSRGSRDESVKGQAPSPRLSWERNEHP